MATVVMTSRATRRYWSAWLWSTAGRSPITSSRATGATPRQCPRCLSDLERRFGLKRVVFVGDRGMVTSDNLDLLRGHGHGYIVGRNRRRSGEVFDYIQSASGPWIECPVGITAREKAVPSKTRVQEVASNPRGVRVFVVHSEERETFERSQRVKAMERVRARLEKLTRRIANGRLKAAEKIGAAAARILARNHGHRYYDWTYQDGAFRFFEHPVHFTREQAYEGKYVIQTEEPTLSAVDDVRLYKELSDVERAFANLKDVLDMRPIYHRTDDRVDAHIYVAALAFLLHRAIESKLKAARLDLSATEALTALRSVRVVDIALGDGTFKRSVPRGTPARRCRVASARHRRSRSPGSAATRRNRHVVLKPHAHCRKISGLDGQMSNMG